VELGYPREKLVQMRVDFAAAGYAGPRLPAAFDAVAAKLALAPGVKGVTYSSHGFFAGGESVDPLIIEGYKPPKAGDSPDSRFERVGPRYFSTLGIPLLLGREPDDRDTANSEKICVVNQAFVKNYFGNRNPLGKHITDDFPDTRETMTIAGVAANAHDHSLRQEVEPRFYIPVSQPLGDYPTQVIFGLRTYGEPSALVNAARKTVLDYDPTIRVARVATLEEQLDTRLQNERIVAQLSAAFGALALLLASVGLYGVLSYGVARRINEIGIRMALGARAGRVVGMILGETALLVGIGLAIGVPVSLLCARFVQTKFFGLQAADPVTLAAALAILLAVALLAAYIPARRAARVDPLVALRYE
jgi:predicted permease